jgi:chemotaxis protein CheC
VTLLEDRLREVTSIGAAHAASALAKLFDRVVMIEPPRCRKLDVADIASAIFRPEEWVAGVFVEVTGAVRGRMGILLSQDVVEDVLERLGVGLADGLDERARSALGELGNIATSAAVTAMAELEGGIVLPSTPWVGYDTAGALLIEALHPYLERLPAYLAETELADRDRVLPLRFLWIPEAVRM